MLRFPPRSPKAKQTWEEGLAEKVPVLMPFGWSMVEMTFSYPLVSWVISMRPVALGRSPQTKNLVV